MYHVGLIVVCFSALNWGILQLTNINVLGRVFAGVVVPEVVIAAIMTVSAVVVLWNNWID